MKNKAILLLAMSLVLTLCGDGGEETAESNLPIIVSCQKGMAEQRIPNMRGIMQARSKPLHVKQGVEQSPRSQATTFEKPAPRGAVKLVDNVDQLIDLLHNEAKVI